MIIFSAESNNSNTLLFCLAPHHRRKAKSLANHPFRWAPLLLVLALVGALTACKAPVQPAAAVPAVLVGVVTLQTESQTLSTELPGRTRAFMVSEVRPQISGIVQKRLFTEGAIVKAGQPLYQIDPAAYQVAVASATATVAKMRATARTAEVNATRNASLVAIDAISRQLYDESLALVQQTAGDLAVAQAALDNAQLNLAYTRVVAPISGRTSLSLVTPGALVTANQVAVLTTISQLDQVYVDVTQSSTELLQLKSDLAQGLFERVGQGDARIRIQLEDGRTYAHPGRLQFSGVGVDSGTGAVTLRAVVPNPEGLLMPGMYVRARLDTGVRQQALLVPQQAVTRDTTGKASVLVVDAASKVERRAISLDAAVGNRWLVVAGLAAGDRVIVDGLQRVRPGDAVTLKEVALNTASPPAASASAPASVASAPAPAASASVR
jgi:membrane fusion protein (multidrug efflux system)